MSSYVESRPNKCGGKPCIAGTRIRVWDIYVAHELQRKSPDAILDDYPELSLAQIHAALAYYWDHKSDIDQQMKQADEFAEQLRAIYGAGPLTRKLGSGDVQRDQVPS